MREILQRLVAVASVGLWSTNAAMGQTGTPHQAQRDLEVPDWGTVVASDPDPSVVQDERVRDRIRETGLAWRVLHQASGVEFLLVPAGEYLRGAAPDDPYDRANERPQHRVVIAEPFYLSRTEITNAQMRRFRADHDSGSWYRDPTYSLNGDDLPAVDVSWLDARAFGEHFGFRLPTEAEWEYAARAGVQTRYPWGDDFREGDGFGNIFDRKTKQVMPGMDWECFPFDDGGRVSTSADRYPANPWGFVDMYGNVWEWCEDVYAEDAYREHVDGCVDPVRRPVRGRGAPMINKRVLRGGGFGNAPRGSGLPYRFGMDEDDRFDGNGFRVVQSVR